MPTDRKGTQTNIDRQNRATDRWLIALRLSWLGVTQLLREGFEQGCRVLCCENTVAE